MILDYLNDSAFFHKNKDILFRIENDKGNIFLGNSKIVEKKLKLKTIRQKIETETIPNDFFGEIFTKENEKTSNDLKILLNFEKDPSKNEISKKKFSQTQYSSSTCSSRSSNTDSRGFLR